MSPKRDLESEGQKIADTTSCVTCGVGVGDACIRTNGTERPYWLVHLDRRLEAKGLTLPGEL